jgi:hypothetical protein
MDTIYYSLEEVELLYKEFMAHRTKNVMVRLLISVQLVFESFLLTCMSSSFAPNQDLAVTSISCL